MSAALLPEDLVACPFCGSAKLMVNYSDKGIRVACCECYFSLPYCDNQLEAKRLWSESARMIKELLGRLDS